MHIVQGLIIADRSIGYILDGSKTWEMRSGPTQVRGAIALISALPATMMPVSSLFSLLLTAGSIATTTRRSVGSPVGGMRAASMSDSFHSAPGVSSSSSASSS